EMSLNDATELMKKNTRNYAKRQMSWLRQRSDFHLLNLSSNSNDETIESIVKIIELSKTMIKV
ncbi:MAG: tRNA (adenosine(37)-N6)-dimethylallyltransferase MiaA, partial [Caldisericia bacterium]|nr:tRNA (adenosine(37)-N6)-dimethylallyltransferase MiaA [Caldisericia bacterium]